MAELQEDLRFAARLLCKNPGFTVVALLTLGLGIGANTAIFSVVNGVLLRPLPFPEHERLFQVARRDASDLLISLSVPQYAFLAAQREPFSRMAAYRSHNSGFNFSGGEFLEYVPGARVTGSFFEVLGISPALGRGFLPEEDVEGGPRVVVLGHGLWQRRFGGRPDIIGRAITLNQQVYTIVGVMPPSFQFPEDAQLWTPMRLDLASTDDSHYLAVIGRLQPGLEPEQVSAQVQAQGEQLRTSRPGALRPNFTLEASGLQTLSTRRTRPALMVLQGAVGLVLLIACVNLASLQLARGASRERELAVRTALGATPGRITRQLLTESLLLSSLGGILGLVLGACGVPALLALAPTDASLPQELSLDATVLAFTLGLSVLTGLLFGILPARQASRVAPQDSLQVGAWRATSGLAERHTRQLLVMGEVALAIILLIGATLLAKSFARLRGVAPGIDPENVLTMKLFLPETRYGAPEALESFARRVQERVRALPGVQAAGFALTLPFEPGLRMSFAIQDRRSDGSSPRAEGLAYYRPVTRGYFEALKIELVRGRLLDDADNHGSLPVVLINESAARRYFPEKDPLGQRITISPTIPQIADPAPREIIGVVRDVHEESLQNGPPAIVYIPLGQIPAALQARTVLLRPENLLIRSQGKDPGLAAAVQREIQGVDSHQLVANVSSMEEILSRSLGLQRFNTLLMGLLAGLALALAAVGIYGVLSHLVHQRTRELSVRLALGATPREVVWLVLRQGMVPVAIGVAMGVAGAVGLTRLLTHELYAVSALDPAAFVAAPAVLIGVALVATWPPARRASRVNPMVALRTE